MGRQAVLLLAALAVRPAAAEAPFDPLAIVTGVPGTLVRFGARIGSVDRLPDLAAIGVSTAVLVRLDGRLYDGTRDWSDRMGLSPDNTYASYLRFPIPGAGKDAFLFHVPTNLGAGFYFLGDGWFHGAVVAGFLGVGAIAGDDEALRTAADLVEVIGCTGVVSLALKMSTGREDPIVRSTPNGRWRFFPNPKRYLDDTPEYDAFPTGHLATLLATTIVIAGHYPDTWWIRPLGYALCVPLGFQMVNSGVHWWSDYPLGMYVGWTMARVVLDRRTGSGGNAPGPVSLGPALLPGGSGLAVRVRL